MLIEPLKFVSKRTVFNPFTWLSIPVPGMIALSLPLATVQAWHVSHVKLYRFDAACWPCTHERLSAPETIWAYVPFPAWQYVHGWAPDHTALRYAFVPPIGFAFEWHHTLLHVPADHVI